MFKKLLVLITLFSSILINGFSSSYTTVNSLKDVENFLLKDKNNEIDTNQAVLFDIYGSLIEYQNNILNKGVNSLIKNLEKEHKDIDSTLLMSIILNDAKLQLIEKDSPDLLKKLREKHLMVLGLTACRTGHFGIINSVEKARLETLSKLGLYFNTYEKLENYKFPELSSFFQMHVQDQEYPLYYKGVLFSGHGGSSCSQNVNEVTKGNLFIAFLDKLKQENYISSYPKQIILVDDKESFLDSLKEECAKLNIPFIGLHFVKKNQDVINPINEKKHFQILINEKKWVDVLPDSDGK